MNQDRDSTDGLKIYGYVAELMDGGADAAEVREKLVEQGVRADEAAGIAERALTRKSKARALISGQSCLREGASAEQIRAKLLAEGHDRQIVSEVIDELLYNWTRTDAETKGNPKRLWRGLGIAIGIAGFVLEFGNRSGLMPTFSYAGILMGVGAIILMMGRE
jgi:hypothetical protein